MKDLIRTNSRRKADVFGIACGSLNTVGPILQEWFGWYLPCSLGADTLVALSILFVNDHADGRDLRTTGGLCLSEWRHP